MAWDDPTSCPTRMNHFSWPFPDSEPHFCRRFALLLPVLQLSHRVFSGFRDAGATKPLCWDPLHEAPEEGAPRSFFRRGSDSTSAGFAPAAGLRLGLAWPRPDNPVGTQRVGSLSLRSTNSADAIHPTLLIQRLTCKLLQQSRNLGGNDFNSSQLRLVVLLHLKVQFQIDKSSPLEDLG